MRTIVDIDILGDAEFQHNMLRLSLVPLCIGVGCACTLALRGSAEAIDGQWFLLLAAFSVLTLPIHELVHAAGFLLEGGRGTRVRFGAQMGMLYASAPGLVLGRDAFVRVLLAPTLLVGVGQGLILAACGFPALGFVASGVHLSGCAGDMLCVAIIANCSDATHCEDTDRGIRLLSDTGAGE